jgi:CO/xanthine dehydrogenase Mo-binding subunit
MLISAAALDVGRSAFFVYGRKQPDQARRNQPKFELWRTRQQGRDFADSDRRPLKQSKDYKIVGQRLPRVDSPAKVKGEAVFGIDFRMPGMKFAVLSRCPTIGGKVSSFDDKESKKISGVSYVGKISDSAVAVVADSVWGAMEGRRVLNVTWDDGPNKDLNTAPRLATR